MIDLTQEDESCPEIDLSQLDDVEDLRPPEGRKPLVSLVDNASTSPRIVENENENLQEETLLNELETRANSLKRLLEIRKQLNKDLLLSSKDRKARGAPVIGSLEIERKCIEKSEMPCPVKGNSVGTTEMRGTKGRTHNIESRAIRQIQKQFTSEKYVLKFIETVVSPEIMMEPLGLSICQSFQRTQEKAEHERMSYRIDRSSRQAYPVITWYRKIPSKENEGCFDIQLQPFVMICMEGKKMVEWIEHGKIEGMIDALSKEMCECNEGQSFKVSIVVHRLDRSICERELEDHKNSIGNGQQPTFSGEKVRQYLMDLSIQNPKIELFDAQSIEEATAHVLSLTKSIAMRHLDEGCASKYIAGRSRARTASKALNTLLVKEPLLRDQLIYPLKALMALSSVVPGVAHAIVTEYSSLAGLYTFLEDPSTTLQEKTRLLENMVASGSGRRVGPKAAKQIVDALLSEDPFFSVY